MRHSRLNYYNGKLVNIIFFILVQILDQPENACLKLLLRHLLPQ